jgi:hypothetical protein
MNMPESFVQAASVASVIGYQSWDVVIFRWFAALLIFQNSKNSIVRLDDVGLHRSEVECNFFCASGIKMVPISNGSGFTTEKIETRSQNSTEIMNTAMRLIIMSLFLFIFVFY